MKQILIAYVPVLHRGYQEFFEKYHEAELWLLDAAELLGFTELEYLKKDIRVLDLSSVEKAIKSWNIFSNVKSIKIKDLEQVNYSNSFVFTNDDIGHFVAKNFFAKAENKTFEPIFLRWDKESMSKQNLVPVGVKLDKSDFEKKIMTKAFAQAGRSSDWWRHVGSIIIKDDKILFAGYNKHLPNNDEQYKNSDPRIPFTSGVGIEFASSIHAEAGLIAHAAKEGIALNGTEIYVTTFPCPICAKQIAEAGIKKVYYAKGYALLDGLEIFKSYGVKTVLIDFSAQELKKLDEIENSNCGVKKRYSLV